MIIWNDGYRVDPSDWCWMPSVVTDLACLCVQQQGQTGSASSQPSLLHMPHRQSPLHQASSASSSSSSSSALSVGQLVSSKCSIQLIESAGSCSSSQRNVQNKPSARRWTGGEKEGVLAPKLTCTKFIATSRHGDVQNYTLFFSAKRHRAGMWR